MNIIKAKASKAVASDAPKATLVSKDEAVMITAEESSIESMIEAEESAAHGDSTGDWFSFDEGVKEESTEDGPKTESKSEAGPEVAQSNWGFIPDEKEHDMATEGVFLQRKRNEFNLNSSQNGLRDEEIEGGIAAFDSKKNSFSDGGVERSNKATGNYELYGFKVTVNGHENGIAHDVTAKFNSEDVAKSSINGDSYIFSLDGEMVVGKIVEGAPKISEGDIEINTYLNGEWMK